MWIRSTFVGLLRMVQFPRKYTLFNVLISPVIKFNRFRYPDWPAGCVTFAYFSWSNTIPQHPFYCINQKSKYNKQKSTQSSYHFNFTELRKLYAYSNTFNAPTYHRVSGLCWYNYFWLAHRRCQTSLDRRFSAIKSQCIRSPLPKRKWFFVGPTVAYHFDYYYMDSTAMVIAVTHYFWLPFCMFGDWSLLYCFPTYSNSDHRFDLSFLLSDF